MTSTTYVRAALAGLLVVISAAMLFVPMAEGAGAVRDMFLMLTLLAVKSFYDSENEDRRAEALKQAYDPTPPPPAILQDGE